MFNEEIETTISMFRDKNHIELLMKIYESDHIPEGYSEYLKQVIKRDVTEYLDTFGGETDV